MIEKVKQINYQYRNVTGKDKKEYTYYTATEWVNGEGYDIDIESKSKTQHISLSFEDIEMINKMIIDLNHLEYIEEN